MGLLTQLKFLVGATAAAALIVLGCAGEDTTNNRSSEISEQDSFNVAGVTETSGLSQCDLSSIPDHLRQKVIQLQAMETQLNQLIKEMDDLLFQADEAKRAGNIVRYNQLMAQYLDKRPALFALRSQFVALQTFLRGFLGQTAPACLRGVLSRAPGGLVSFFGKMALGVACAAIGEVVLNPNTCYGAEPGGPTVWSCSDAESQLTAAQSDYQIFCEDILYTRYGRNPPQCLGCDYNEMDEFDEAVAMCNEAKTARDQAQFARDSACPNTSP